MTVGEAQAYGGVIKGLHGARQFRARGRRQIAAAISPTSTSKAAWASCSVCVGSKAKAILRSWSKAAATACLAVTQTLNGTANLDRDERRACGPQCRAVAAAARAAAASGGGEFRSGRTPFDKIDGRAEDQSGHGDGRGREDREALRWFSALAGSASIPAREA